MNLPLHGLVIILLLLARPYESFADRKGELDPTPTTEPKITATNTPKASATPTPQGTAPTQQTPPNSNTPPTNGTVVPPNTDDGQIYNLPKLPKAWRSKAIKRLGLACQFKDGVRPVIKKGARYRNLSASDLARVVPRTKAASMLKQLKKLCITQWLVAAPSATPTNSPQDPTPTPLVPNDATATPTSVPSATPSSTPTAARQLPSACSAEHGVDCPILFSVSPEASAGDVINIAGGTFSNNAKVFLNPISDDGVLLNQEPYQLALENNHFAMLQARIPLQLTTRAPWAIWVEQNGAVSNTLFINRATATHQSTRMIAPGDELTIWGRALSLGGIDNHHSSVRFVSGQTALQASVVEEDPYRLRVLAPASIQPGLTYRVEVTNGAAGALGISNLADDITAIAKGSDPLNLKVWWVNQISSAVWSNVYDVKTDPRLIGHYASGDGLADDRAAIQYALDQAGLAGGGIVYLPNGIYRTTNLLQINYPNVILKGAGQNFTRIRYGQADSNSGAIAFAEGIVKFAGVTSLTIENVKPSGGNGNLSIFAFSYDGIEKIFVNDVKLLLGDQGQTISLGDRVNHILISNCDITLTKRRDFPGMNHAALWIVAADDVVIRDNTVRYDIGRIQVQQNSHLVMTGNHFIRNGSAEAMNDRLWRHNESGGVEFSFTTDSVYDRNEVDLSPPAPVDNFNDSEVFMTQGSIYGFSDWGEVSSATATTITDNSVDCSGNVKNWQPGDLVAPLPETRAIVAITRGQGLGQWRYIVGGQGSTLTVDRPFDIIPDSSSSYTISIWTVDSPYLIDNRVEGGWWCVDFYSGGLNLDVHRNTCIDAGPIQTMGIDLYPAVGDCTDYVRYLAWNISYTKNLVQTTARRLLPSNIKIQLEQFTDPNDPQHPKMHANTVLNSEMRDNAIIAGVPNVPPPQFYHGGALFHEDGKMYSTIGGAGHPTGGDLYYPDADYGMLGTIASGNTSQNYSGSGDFFEATTLGNKLLVVDTAQE